MNSRSHVTATHNLLTAAWTANVEALETAVGHLAPDGPLPNDCQVAFFEIVRDGQLHVNVTHKHQTKTIRGWAGPARRPDGYVHNRRFGDVPLHRIARDIREMVLAELI